MVKWTLEYDQMLFSAFLQSHPISYKAEKIREAWPINRGEIPTVRAISDRILKIKKEAGGISSSAKKQIKENTVPPSPPKSKKHKHNAADAYGSIIQDIANGTALDINSNLKTEHDEPQHEERAKVAIKQEPTTPRRKLLFPSPSSRTSNKSGGSGKRKWSELDGNHILDSTSSSSTSLSLSSPTPITPRNRPLRTAKTGPKSARSLTVGGEGNDSFGMMRLGNGLDTESSSGDADASADEDYTPET